MSMPANLKQIQKKKSVRILQLQTDTSLQNSTAV